MRIKTSDLTGAALAYMVNVCEGFTPKFARNSFGCMVLLNGIDPLGWNEGGPIIDREGISLRPIRKAGHELDGQCLAAYDHGNTGTMVHWVKRTDWPKHYFIGPTPPIAGMRCFVASRLGEVVDVPEELLADPEQAQPVRSEGAPQPRERG